MAVLADMLDLGAESDRIHFQIGKQLKNYDLKEILTYGEWSAYITQGALLECGANVMIRHFADKNQ